MVKYIHIGYPKNFSTSLQRDYFSASKQIFHLGIGLNDNLGYYDAISDKTFEVYLKTAKGYAFNKVKHELKNHFYKLFEKATSSCCYKAFGASSEHLSFAFAYDSISLETKIERLAELFGSEIKIIIILRNQIDLIKSLFRESIRVGFKGDFSRYIYLLYKYQDRNYFNDLQYDWVYSSFSNVFGVENLYILFFENYRQVGNITKTSTGQPKIFRSLDGILNVNTEKLNIGHYNEALTENQLLTKQQLNLQNDHDLGNHMYETAEKHRIKTYLVEDLNLIEDEKVVYEDVLVKRELIKKSNELSRENEKIEYSCDPKIFESMRQSFLKSNRNFEAVANRKLPDEYFSF